MTGIIDEIKARVDLLEYAKNHIQLKKKGQLWQGICPFHSEKSGSFTIYEDGHFVCFGCHVSGDIIDFVQLSNGWDISTTIDFLAEQYHIPRPEKKESKQNETLYPILEEVAQHYQNRLLHDDNKSVSDYLYLRGITDKDIEKWRLGYADGTLIAHLQALGYELKAMQFANIIYPQGLTPHERFLNRIIYPIFDAKGRVVGFSGRSLKSEAKPKYINSPESDLFKKRELLYGYHLAKDEIRQSGEVIIVEGFMDAIAAHRAGYSNVVAQMGTALTTEQMQLIRAAKTIYLAMDGDDGGIAAIERALELLSETSSDIRIVRLDDDTDVDDAIQNGDWKQKLDQSLSAPEYVIQRVLLSVPEAASIVQRTNIAQAVIPLLMKLENDVIRASSIQKLALELGLNARSLQIQAHQHIKTAQALSIKKIKSPTHEAVILSIFIHFRAKYFHVNELFGKIKEPPISDLDFKDLKHEFALFHASIVNGVDENIAEDIGIEKIESFPDERLEQMILELRFKSLVRQIEQAIQNKEFDKVHKLTKRKAKIRKKQHSG